jgi:hypothetical protein
MGEIKLMSLKQGLKTKVFNLCRGINEIRRVTNL